MKTNGYGTLHLAIKAKKRKEAEERNQRWQNLSKAAKIQELLDRPGNCEKQLRKLGA